MSDGDFQVPDGLMPCIEKHFHYPMSTLGTHLINHERIRQINYKKRTIEDDYKLNADYQLVDAAIKLLKGRQHESPEGWDSEMWNKMLAKDDYKRLAIAGALIAAEIDRLNYIQ